MTIERLLSRRILSRRGIVVVADRGCLLYLGEFGRIPVILFDREVYEVTIRYSDIRPDEMIIMVVTQEGDQDNDN